MDLDLVPAAWASVPGDSSSFVFSNSFWLLCCWPGLLLHPNDAAPWRLSLACFSLVCSLISALWMFLSKQALSWLCPLSAFLVNSSNYMSLITLVYSVKYIFHCCCQQCAILSLPICQVSQEPGLQYFFNAPTCTSHKGTVQLRVLGVGVLLSTVGKLKPSVLLLATLTSGWCAVHQVSEVQGCDRLKRTFAKMYLI